MSKDTVSKPVLSICIPTYKRVDILKELLNSIIAQNADPAVFEVCITDNSETDETEDLIKTEYSNITNLRYKRVKVPGFLNSVEALRFGGGEYLKLHNDYSILKEGFIQQLINDINAAKNNDAYIFFSLGEIKNGKKIESFDSYDGFMRYIGYQATWSSSFGIWKKDFDAIEDSGIKPDHMFPHTSYLHRITGYTTYVVNNEKLVNNILPAKKGGYNFIDNFVRIYLNMVKEDLLKKEVITSNTYKYIERGIIRFCANWYYIVVDDPERYSFTFDNDERIVENVCENEGLQEYRRYKDLYWMKHILRRIKRVICGKKRTDNGFRYV